MNPGVPVTVTAAGAAGAASGTGQTTIEPRAYLDAIRLAYTGAPATTDVVVRNGGSAGEVILSVANASANAIFYPRREVHTSAGASAAAQVRHAIDGHLHVSVAQADPDAVVVVRPIYCAYQVS